MTLRHWLRAPKQTLLQVFILSLGIAVFFSIRLANKAAVNSFEHFTTLLHQESDYSIKPLEGRLPTTLLKELREDLGTMPVDLIPILESSATESLAAAEKQTPSPLFELLGLDLIALQNATWLVHADRHKSLPDQSEDMVLTQLANTGKAKNLFISHALALEKHLKLGDFFPLVVHDEVIEFHITGFIPETGSGSQVSSHLLMIDLPDLQEITHEEGKISEIHCILPDSIQGTHNSSLRDLGKKNLLEHLCQIRHARFNIVTPKDEQAKAALMTRAFRMNLTILSLVALLAGLYLILQALDGAVVRRRGEIAILRSLGVTEKMIQSHWLMEALLLGVCGGVIGSLIGWGGAQLAVRSVGAIVNALYYTTTIDAAHLDFGEFLLALLLAVGSSLLTGWWPARQAARTPPAQILSHEYDKNRQVGMLQSIKIGWLLLLLSGLLSLAPAVTLFKNRHLPLCGYVATLFLILGAGIFCGFFTEQLASLISYFSKFSIVIKLTTSHLRPLSKRHYLAASGILSGVTMAAGMLILIASFEKTMQCWIATTFQADLYISSADYQGAAPGHPLSPQIVTRIADDPGVADVEIIASHHLILEELPTMMSGIDVGFLKRHHNILWKQAPANNDFFDESKNSHLVLASESFLERFEHHYGDYVTIPTPAGNQEMKIVGVFSDYGNEQGVLYLDRHHFSHYFRDDLATVLIVTLKPGVDAQELRLQLSSQFPGLSILTNRNLREEILRIFHQTFSITYALELIGIIVAIIGLGMTLSNILIDRSRELTTLRALGCTHHTIATATALEGGLLALSAALIGIMTSLGIGYILIYVINKQSFGWTLQFTLPYVSLGLLGMAVVIAGVSVAYQVGFKSAPLRIELHE